MKKYLVTISILFGLHSMSAAADKLSSFDHAAELTDQAKTILFQEVNETGIPNSKHREMVCLAENIYFEARAESIEGKAGVANVTRNRVNSTLFPNTYCDVVYQGPVRESWKSGTYNFILIKFISIRWIHYYRMFIMPYGSYKFWLFFHCGL